MIRLCLRCGKEFNARHGNHFHCTTCGHTLVHEAANEASSSQPAPPPTITLRNGLEVLNNVFGKEIAGARI